MKQLLALAIILLCTACYQPDNGSKETHTVNLAAKSYGTKVATENELQVAVL
jgi:hypothetical protein